MAAQMCGGREEKEQPPAEEGEVGYRGWERRLAGPTTLPSLRSGHANQASRVFVSLALLSHCRMAARMSGERKNSEEHLLFIGVSAHGGVTAGRGGPAYRGQAKPS